VAWGKVVMNLCGEEGGLNDIWLEMY